MPTAERRSREEVARIGHEVYDRVVQPLLRPEDDGKFVAVDIDTGDYEADADDYTAVMRLRARRPDGEFWLERAGEPTAYRMPRMTGIRAVGPR